MVKKDQAEEILRDTIKNNKTHRDYQYVVDYAARMRRLITGVGLDMELRQFVRREDDKMFEQRKILTQLITPSICSSLMTPYWKIARVNPVTKKVTLGTVQPKANGQKPEADTKQNSAEEPSSTILLPAKNDGMDAKQAKLTKAANNYYGTESVDDYLEKRWIPHIFLDPNAFVLTTFDKFDNKFEVAKPYPTEICCEDAVNFEYANNVLQWLIVRKCIKYTEKVIMDDKAVPIDVQVKEKDGSLYQIYADNDIIEYEQCDPILHQGSIGELLVIGNDEDGTKQFVYKFDNAHVFIVRYYEPKAGMVQAKRVGVFQDMATDGRTCVSPLQPALPYLMKSIKAVSELDISIALHVFLQKLQYLPKCAGTDLAPCNNGYLINNEKCTICNGTGLQVATSAQDAITMALPRDAKEAWKLIDLVQYVAIPIEIVKFLDEFIDKIEKKCVKSMYNSELFSTDTLVNTATEKKTDMESVNDALYPAGQAYSAMWCYIMKLISVFVDIKDAVPEHQFPKDFKFRGLNELIYNLDAVSKSNAPAFVRQEISNDIANIVFADKPDELKRIKVKQQFSPFDGKTIDEINTILSNSKLSPQKDKVMWSMAARIFTEIEQEHPQDDINGWFYDMAWKKQKELIDAKIEEIMQEIEDDNPPAQMFGADGLPINVAAQGEPVLDENGQPKLAAPDPNAARSKDGGNKGGGNPFPPVK